MSASFSNSLVLDPKSRENRGVKVRKAVSDDEKRNAEKLNWVFFCREDKSVFRLTLNHCSWPNWYGFYDKMNIPKRTVINMKTLRGYYDCQFVEKCPEKEYHHRLERLERIINTAKAKNDTIAELSMSLELVFFLSHGERFHLVLSEERCIGRVLKLNLFSRQENNENVPIDRSVGDLFEEFQASCETQPSVLTSTQKKTVKRAADTAGTSKAKRHLVEPVIRLGTNAEDLDVRIQDGDVTIQATSSENNGQSEDRVSILEFLLMCFRLRSSL